MVRGSWLVASGSWFVGVVANGSWLVASGSWFVGVAPWATRRVLGNTIPKLENHSYSEAGLPRASPYRCDASGISFLVVSGSWLVVRKGRPESLSGPPGTD